MAVTITEAELAGAAGFEVGVAMRLLPVVRARVERFAPDAPAEVQNEACIRFAAYLAGAKPVPTAAGSVSAGAVSLTEHSHSHATAFRASGSRGLLSAWRIARGAPVEAE